MIVFRQIRRSRLCLGFNLSCFWVARGSYFLILLHSRFDFLVGRNLVGNFGCCAFLHGWLIRIAGSPSEGLVWV